MLSENKGKNTRIRSLAIPTRSLKKVRLANAIDHQFINLIKTVFYSSGKLMVTETYLTSQSIARFCYYMITLSIQFQFSLTGWPDEKKANLAIMPI